MPTTKVHRARGSRAAVYGIIACTLAVDIFAIRSTDPDFFFPDPFKYLILFLLVAFVLVDLVRAPRVRVALFSVLFAIPAVSLLLEWRTAARDARTGHLMVEKSSDPVLRFNYRPGFDTNEKSPSGGELKITSDWLWDVPHAVTKPKGTYRVMVLGDSVPNDPTIPFMSRYPKRLEAKLRKRFPGTPIQVMNVSCEGYNTVQEVELLEDVRAQVPPGPGGTLLRVERPVPPERRVPPHRQQLLPVPFAGARFGGLCRLVLPRLPDLPEGLCLRPHRPQLADACDCWPISTSST